MKDKYGYQTVKQCFDDRALHRAEWFNLICEYNREDPIRLCKEIFKSNQVYVGIRSNTELEAAKKTWADCLVIWIDAEGRVESEGIESCSISKDQADIVIENKLDVKEFESKLDKLCVLLRSYYGSS